MNDSTIMNTGVVRISYANIWAPKAIQEGQEPKYSVSLLIPKSDKKTLNMMNSIIESLKQNVSAKNGGKLPPRFKLPLRDGDTDEAKADDKNYAGHYFVNATAKKQPGIVDRNRQTIIDKGTVYSGCYCIANINFYIFNNNGSKGIACGINHLMKVRDGGHLDGRKSAEEAFAEIVFDDVDDFDELLA